ncbi:N-6 DNA methylase [Thiorhodococcus minor]|uniref:site-specific DNA-methyltransferase (adenine-specific) n=1 Tax=Thiorhodococcus minor TaxID=57489 RepID=A0A6M0JYT5_9GAMM|nr:N-6 DNA methylase [Thiorhodococcus minor]NEV62339.1 N-6 DNA methylase [Thiorhodococcus minor]
MLHDSPARALARELETFANRGRRYRPDEWLTFLCQDVLAGFGRRLDQPWDEERRERLFQLSRTYASLVAEHPWTDLLGSVYMELSSRGQQRWLGQFFTPPAVATCMAELQLADLNDRLSAGDTLIRVLEPAAGSGVMLLALCQVVLKRHGRTALSRLSLTAVDLDPLCAAMTATQLLANAVVHGPLGELRVDHGNALTGELFETLVAVRSAPQRDDSELVPVAPIRPPESPTASSSPAPAACWGEQLSLF